MITKELYKGSDNRTLMLKSWQENHDNRAISYKIIEHNIISQGSELIFF